MSKTNFDIFLEEQLQDPDFAERFKRAGEAGCRGLLGSDCK